MNPDLAQATHAIQQAFVAKGKNTAVAEGQVTPAQLIDAYAAPERRPRDPAGDRPVQANTGSRYSNIGAAYGSLHCAATLAQRCASQFQILFNKLDQDFGPSGAIPNDGASELADHAIHCLLDLGAWAGQLDLHDPPAGA